MQAHLGQEVGQAKNLKGANFCSLKKSRNRQSRRLFTSDSEDNLGKSESYPFWKYLKYHWHDDTELDTARDGS